jgi:hypothetical protein
MRLLAALWEYLAGGLAPAFAGNSPANLTRDEAREDAYRQSIHDVTLEQLGIDHWSCHTLF